MSQKSQTADGRKNDLLDIGTQLFIDKGIEYVSIKDIVNETGVATGLFYYYFSSKEAFIEEAINRFILKYVDNLIDVLLREDLSLTERILKALLDFESHFGKITALWNNSILTSSQHHTFENAIILQITPLLESVIKRGVEERVFRPINPSIAATFFLHGLSGVLHMKLVNDSSFDYSSTIEQIVFSSLGIKITKKD